MFYFTLEFPIYLDLFSVFVGISKLALLNTYEYVQFQIEKRTISGRGSRSPQICLGLNADEIQIPLRPVVRINTARPQINLLPSECGTKSHLMLAALHE